MKILCRFLPVVILLTIFVQTTEAAPADMEVLLKGISIVAPPRNLPAPVAVFGEEAFPVLVGKMSGSKTVRLPLLGAARYGAGRVVLAGCPELYDSPDLKGHRELMANTVAWLAGDRKPPIRVVAVDHLKMVPILKEAGFDVTQVPFDKLAAALPQTDVILLRGDRLTPLKQSGLIETIAEFIRNGGGYFDAMSGRNWPQKNGGKSLAEDQGGNRLTARMGLAFCSGTVTEANKLGWVAVHKVPALCDPNLALEILVRHAAGSARLSQDDCVQAFWLLSEAINALPANDTLFLPRLRAALAARPNPKIPMPDAPLTVEQPLDRLACRVEAMDLRRMENLRPHPAAVEFPGLVPEGAPRVEKVVQIDCAVRDWHSVGLYAAPGQVIEVALPEQAVTAGLRLRIGTHGDVIWQSRYSDWETEPWRRFPDICNGTALDKPLVRLGNAFGGVIYITVPKDSRAGIVPVTVRNAVEMPYFVLGETSPQLWRSTLRNLQAPMAELATKKIILTVPAPVVRNLDDPTEVLRLWDVGLDAAAELAAIPLERSRPERMCFDARSRMHSGYPMVAYYERAATSADREALIRNRAHTWGFWHELGHNHQSSHWTFSGTSETTVNLFTLYCLEKVSGSPVTRSINVAELNGKVAQYFAQGAKFDKWCADPMLSLMFYVQLQQGFGWDAYKRLFAEYRASATDTLPRNDDEERDQFMVRFSRQVGCNLGPFFEAWGIPTSAQARNSIKDLPDWLPAAFKKGVHVAGVR